MPTLAVGGIIKIPHLVPSLDARAKAEERIPCALIGGHICPKVRYAVIVALYAQRMIVLPIYSCNKQGVTNKSDEYKSTAISIWNPMDQRPEVKELLTRDALGTIGGHKFFQGSHINLTDQVSVSYNWNITHARTELRLTDREFLLARYRLLQESAHLPVGQDKAFFQRGVERQRAQKLAAARASQPPPTSGQSPAGSVAPSWAKMAGKVESNVSGTTQRR